MSDSPRWMRILLGLCCVVALLGVFEMAMGDRRRAFAELEGCQDRNRTHLAEAARFSEAQNIPAAVASLSRLAECSAPHARPWIVLLAGLAGALLILLTMAILARLQRLPAAAPAAPKTQAAPASPPIGENLVQQVTDEMRAQGLNITPEVARHIAAMRVPKPEGGAG